MKDIASLVGRELKWSQPSALKMEYELGAGDETVATLHFRSSFGSFATAQWGGDCWTFKRVGFFRTHVTIRRCGDGTHDIATFKDKTWSAGGTLEFPGGRTFPASTNFWATKYSFNTQSGEPLIEFNTGGLVHLSAKVEIHHQAASLAELPLMLTLGWYLAVLMKNDTGGAVAAAAG